MESASSVQPFSAIDFSRLQNIDKTKKKYQLLNLEIKNIDVEHLCIQCNDLLEKPIALECGHGFIDKSCLDRYIKKCEKDKSIPSIHCPIEECKIVADVEKLQSVPLDITVMEKIDQTYLVSCPYKEQGCRWSDKYKMLDQHMQAGCSYQVESLSSSSKDKSNEGQICSGASDFPLDDISASSEPLKTLQMFYLQMESFQKNQKYQQEVLEKASKDFEAQKQKIAQLESEIKTLKLQSENVMLEKNKNVPEKDEEKKENQENIKTQKEINECLDKYNVRFQCLESTSYDGVLIWKITNYQKRKEDAIKGRTISLYSQPFYTHPYGYKMCARVYLNGDGDAKGSHFSLFFVVMKGEYDSILSWPFQQKVTLSLLDQSGGGQHIEDNFQPNPSSNSFERPQSVMNIASGSPYFLSQKKLGKKSPYVRENSIFIKVVIDTTDLGLKDPIHHQQQLNKILHSQKQLSGDIGYNGQLLWKIDTYSEKKQKVTEGEVDSLCSPLFYTTGNKNGYKMSLKACFNSKGKEKNKSTYLSLFLVVMEGKYDALLKWPFKANVILTLLDQSDQGRHVTDTYRPKSTIDNLKPSADKVSVVAGNSYFFKQSILEESSCYLKNDTIYIKAEVDISAIDDPVHSHYFSKKEKIDKPNQKRERAMSI